MRVNYYFYLFFEYRLDYKNNEILEVLIFFSTRDKWGEKVWYVKSFGRLVINWIYVSFNWVQVSRFIGKGQQQHYKWTPLVMVFWIIITRAPDLLRMFSEINYFIFELDFIQHVKSIRSSMLFFSIYW